MPLIVSSIPTLINNHFNKRPIPYFMTYTNDLENFDILSYFPLSEGNYWEYDYEFEFQEDGSEILNRKGTFKMKVLEKYDLEEYSLFRLKGDAFSIHRDEIDNEFGLLLISNKIYHIPNYIFKNLLPILVNETELDDTDRYSALEDSITSINLIAEMPFFNNQKIGDLDTLIYSRESYKWNVYGTRIDYKEVNGQITNTTRYSLNYNTTSDCTEYNFIPYLGFESFDYNRSGSGDISGKIRLINYKFN